MLEEWRTIEEFPKYAISSLGNIKNIATDRLRAVHVNHQGFPTLVLYDSPDPTRYVRQVNRLVAEAFLPPPEHRSLNAIWHLDGDLTNCAADNLRWDRRDRVLEWNEMHRTGTPKYRTPKVLYNRTGDIFENAFEAGLATGEIESSIIGHIEKYPEQYAHRARYRYV